MLHDSKFVRIAVRPSTEYVPTKKADLDLWKHGWTMSVIESFGTLRRTGLNLVAVARLENIRVNRPEKIPSRGSSFSRKATAEQLPVDILQPRASKLFAEEHCPVGTLSWVGDFTSRWQESGVGLTCWLVFAF